jgi:hypothetical protein
MPDYLKVLEEAKGIAPVVATGALAGRYMTFATTQAFVAPRTKRAAGGVTAEAKFGGTMTDFVLENNALKAAVDQEIEIPLAGGNALVLEKAKLHGLLAQSVQSLALDVYTILKAGVSVVANKGNWSSANVDPIDEIDGQIEAVARYGMPNRLTMDIGAWRIAKNNPLTKKRFTGGKGFGLADFAAQLLNPNIQIELTDVGINTYGFDNASQTPRAMLGSEVWVFHTSLAPSQYDPSFMKTFATKAALFDGVWTYHDDSCRSEIYCLDWTSKPVVVSSSLARRLTIT